VAGGPPSVKFCPTRLKPLVTLLSSRHHLLRPAACSWLSTQIEQLCWSCATGVSAKVWSAQLCLAVAHRLFPSGRSNGTNR